MSSALNMRADSSMQSVGTHLDLSLGSLASGFSTPAKSLRIPSTSSGTTAPSTAPLTTPSPPTYFRRPTSEVTPVARRLGLSGHDEDGEDPEVDILNTVVRDKKWDEGADTPLNGRSKRARTSAAGAKSVNLTLRDQEKVRALVHCGMLWSGGVACLVGWSAAGSSTVNSSSTVKCQTDALCAGDHEPSKSWYAGSRSIPSLQLMFSSCRRTPLCFTLHLCPNPD